MSVMSNTVKTKFAGMLRGLLRRLDDNEPTTAPAPVSRVLTSNVLPTGAAPAATTTPQRAPAAPAVTTPAAPPTPEENPDELQLPLQTVLAAMPMDLRAKVMQAPPPGTIISVPLATKLGLFDEDHGRLLISTGGIGGSAPAVRSIIDTVEVGGAVNTFVPITIIKPISDSFDGLLGMDFFSNYSVTIDTKRNVVIFEELPIDPEHPGGHDKEWWTTLFKEFSTSRARWKAYGESLDKKIRDSMQSIGNEDAERKKFAEDQYREADKLFDKLNRYAQEHSVPMHWKQY